MADRKPTFLCMASFYKGTAFIEECRALGCNTLLLTNEHLKDKAWPWHAIDERFFMHDIYRQPDVTRWACYGPNNGSKPGLLTKTRKVALAFIVNAARKAPNHA